MIDGHRSQIAGSEGGSVDSVLSRHKKVKQSIGDSIKLAGDKDIAAQSLKEERQAIHDYSQRLETAKSDPLKKALHHALPEERVHAELFGGVLKHAFTLGDIGILGMGGAAAGALAAPKGKRLRGAAIGGIAAPVAGIGGTALINKGLSKIAMLPSQPPADPKIQQEWRGRPKKMKDTTSVAGAMESTNTMLQQASTTAGPTQ